jgi:hypothetical protein
MTNVRAYTLTECEQSMGEEALDVFLQSFSCPLNLEIERFLKERARHSMRMSSSMTYLVWNEERHELLGYFTLVAKAYSVVGKMLSSKNRRLVERFAEIDEAGVFTAAVYLIAQLGKNFALPECHRISGGDLLSLALEKFLSVKSIIGGKLVMVERESDRPKLLDFYKKNGFKSWTTRVNAKDGVAYDQMFTVLSDIKETA